MYLFDYTVGLSITVTLEKSIMLRIKPNPDGKIIMDSHYRIGLF